MMIRYQVELADEYGTCYGVTPDGRMDQGDGQFTYGLRVLALVPLNAGGRAVPWCEVDHLIRRGVWLLSGSDPAYALRVLDAGCVRDWPALVREVRRV